MGHSSDDDDLYRCLSQVSYDRQYRQYHSAKFNIVDPGVGGNAGSPK
jgi:hypothetical protein